MWTTAGRVPERASAALPSTIGFMAMRCTTSGFSAFRMRASPMAEAISTAGLVDERR